MTATAATLVAAVAFLPTLAHTGTSFRAERRVNVGERRLTDGAHDFDFLAGQWNVHHRLLKTRLAGSREWEEFDGTLVNRPTLDGMGNISDNVFDSPRGTYRGVGMRAFDAKSGLWSSWWLDARNPVIDPPMRGKFTNGVGLFTADDSLNGKPIKVRVIWSRITRSSAHWEQAYSPDGGKTWEVNWISDFARSAKTTSVDSSTATGHEHDWDWLVGRWTVRHHRLKARLAGSTEWQDFNGTSILWLTLEGLGTADDNVLEAPSGSYRAMGLRAFNPKSGQWSIWWLDGRNPSRLDPPVQGSFRDGVGTFAGDDSLNGKPIKVRYQWSKITPTSAHWEQAFSPDGGATWETNWTMEFTRAGR